MEIKASLNQLRMSPRKMRLVTDLVRKMPIDKAINQLRFANKLAAGPLQKLIESAIANANNLYSIGSDNLMIKEVKVDEGQTLKRWMPRAHGRATTIRKRSCHVHLTLSEIRESGATKKKEAKVDAPIKLEAIADEAKKSIKKSDSEKSEKDTSKKGESKSGGGFAKKVFNRKVG
jgi:large subunit ribosomal protein L22